ncbi:hypothetical protein AAEX63_16205 [Luteococcus sp. H138]|uniref:hypothetical protein n=1 Tax=unclassified Luteococcus TaxID=2639923 RepID=UPI00313C0681
MKSSENKAKQIAAMVFIVMCALTVSICVREPTTGHIVFAVVATLGFTALTYALTLAIYRGRAAKRDQS